MNHRLNRIRSILCLALPLGAALAACAPAPTPSTVAPIGATPTITAVPTKTPTIIPTSYSQALPSVSPEVRTPVPTSAPSLSVTIHRIQMIDSSTGWAEGQVRTDEGLRILRTTDGGSFWSDISPDPSLNYGRSFFLDAELAWVMAHSDNQAWRTRDGGQIWEALAGESWSFDEIWFNDSDHGWKVDSEPGYGITSFSTTDDGGLTWEEVNPPPGGGLPFGFPNELTAWAIQARMFGDAHAGPWLAVPIEIDTTNDGGDTWISRMLPNPPDTRIIDSYDWGPILGGAEDCFFLSPVYNSTAIWKFALVCYWNSWIYTSANQGKTWIISPMPAGAYLRDIEFINPTVGWLFVAEFEESKRNLHQTTDGGQSWTLIKRTGWLDVELSFVDAQMGWAVACDNAYCSEPVAVRALLKTSDGGLTWEILEPQFVP